MKKFTILGLLGLAILVPSSSFAIGSWEGWTNCIRNCHLDISRPIYKSCETICHERYHKMSGESDCVKNLALEMQGEQDSPQIQALWQEVFQINVD